MTNSTSTRKPTKRDRFNALLAIPQVSADADLVEFINHELELLDRKNTAERKPTAKQTENAGIKSAILGWMENGISYDASTIVKECPVCEGLTAQRVSALLTQLVNDGAVVKTVEKRKSFYSLA